MLWFTYFETGYGKTGYLKLFIYLGGIGAFTDIISLDLAILGALMYGVGCQVFGWLWFRLELFTYQAEVGNQYNPFMRETRKFINK